MSFVGTPDPDPNSGWLSDADLAAARRRLPILYVEAIPVRLDGRGLIDEVGLLLRVSSAGTMMRTFVSGRVMFGELVRDALIRHLEKDLGPMAFPQIPVSATPVTVAEYFPSPSITALTDDRQHMVSLVYVVPVTGTCEPRQDALELSWMSPSEALSPGVASEMEGGRGELLARTLAAVGVTARSES